VIGLVNNTDNLRQEFYLNDLTRVGFVGRDNLSTLYASCANGTASTNVDISSFINADGINRFRIEWDQANTVARFYVNESLAATITTNLPTSVTDPMHFGMGATAFQTGMYWSGIFEPTFAIKRVSTL